MLYVVCHAQWSGDDTILCVPSYFVLCDLPEPHGARGDVCVGNLSNASGDRFYSRLATNEITTHGNKALPLQNVQLS
jgi:hypothetical protein